MDFKKKYFKYKSKYLRLKQIGSGRFISYPEARVVPKTIAKVSTKIEGPISYYYLTYNDKRFLMMGDHHEAAENCYDESGITVVNYIKNILEKEKKEKKCIDFFLESLYYGNLASKRGDEYIPYYSHLLSLSSNGSTKHLIALRNFFVTNHDKNDYFRFHETDIRQSKFVREGQYRKYKGLLHFALHLMNSVPSSQTDKERTFFDNLIYLKEKQIKELEKKEDVAYNEGKKKEEEKIFEEKMIIKNMDDEIFIKEEKMKFIEYLNNMISYYVGDPRITEENVKEILEKLSPYVNDIWSHTFKSKEDIKDEIFMKKFIIKQKSKCDQSIAVKIINEIKESMKEEILAGTSNFINTKWYMLLVFGTKMVDLYTLLRMFRIDDGSRKRSIEGCLDNEFKNIIGYFGDVHTKNIVNILQKIGAKLIFKKENIVDGKQKQCLDIGNFVPFQDVKEGQSQVKLKD
jgi:hypothetical protein